MMEKIQLNTRFLWKKMSQGPLPIETTYQPRNIYLPRPTEKIPILQKYQKSIIYTREFSGNISKYNLANALIH